MKRFLMLVLLLPLFACGDDSTGPEENLNGTWRFSYSNMTGSYIGITVTCTVTAVDVTLTTSGNTFSGIQQGTGRLTCTGGGQTLADSQIAGETIVNGQINGSTVTFRLGSINGQHTGTITGTSMTGTAQWIISSGNVSVTLNGQFTAAKT
jgi:hypothetical protein